jgi:hypothetical protein|tara:strand:- start:167 stop:418 length:252 start_codon:yes stop_codon:yes gene_type:complete
MLKADGYEEALMGVVQRFGQESVTLYDTDKILGILVCRDGMTYDEAVEFFEFNILGSWVGDQTPAFFSKASLEDLKEEEGECG